MLAQPFQSNRNYLFIAIIFLPSLSVSHVSVTFLQPPHIQWWGYRLNLESSMLFIHAHSSHSTHNISACLAFLTMFGMFSSEAAVEN